MPVMLSVSLPDPLGSVRLTVVDAGTDDGLRASVKVTTKVSPAWIRPANEPLVSLIVTGTGLAPSAGAPAANDARLAAASRTPAALVARATVIDPTAVSAAPVPSVRVRVAVADDTATV